MKAILQRLASTPLPGQLDLTWADLAEQVAAERGVELADMLGSDRNKRAIGALHYLWGVLTGAGYPPLQIATRFSMSEERVITGIRRAEGCHR